DLGRRIPQPPARDEIGWLVETFNEMIGRLESPFDAMRRFTADASHQLRTARHDARGDGGERPGPGDPRAQARARLRPLLPKDRDERQLCGAGLGLSIAAW